MKNIKVILIVLLVVVIVAEAAYLYLSSNQPVPVAPKDQAAATSTPASLDSLSSPLPTSTPREQNGALKPSPLLNSLATTTPKQPSGGTNTSSGGANTQLLDSLRSK